ncbi:hypothetical protein CFIMG_003563RA [Ceratocystis fimbriata CBS 114723]|uniref:Uncharacterized protein n=1 Tax=Ceratocystis fimbriata CBS 114723 TaxID=1035309 RepID=A0A2C5X0K2_9PEZI|nr:hypothetical protein CFIMG_003563RA [Ceratocystis fimbriata CBS 114723]
MSEEPTLPPLPPIDKNDLHTQTPICNPRKRALQRSECYPPSFATSSDPAIFSSDDDPSLENYEPSSERRKRRLVGSWYEHNVAAPSSSDSTFTDDTVLQKPVRPVTRRIFTKNFDSGIYLGSDGMTTDDDSLAMPPPPPPIRSRRLTMGLGCQLSEEQRQARRIVERCVQDSDEMIDLSLLSLESLDNDSLAPLNNLTYIPTVVDGAPFEPREPKIKILLSNNCLRSMPGALIDIENITYLSLRANKLSELPPSIGKMKNLEILNVASNNLRYLPRSLLKLLGPSGKLKDLLLHPNPLIQPETLFTRSLLDIDKAQEKCTGVAAFYLDRSATQFLSTSGHICSQTTIPLLPTAATIPCNGEALDAATPFDAGPGSNVASLVELVLRQCYNSSHLRELPKYVEGHEFQGIRELLESTQELYNLRGNTCASCEKLLVKPATQWIEWWAIARLQVSDTVSQTGSVEANKPTISLIDENGGISVPFFAEGCTWKCRPRPIPQSTSFATL